MAKKKRRPLLKFPRRMQKKLIVMFTIVAGMLIGLIGRLMYIDTGVSDALQADLLRAAGFTVDGRSTTIYGTCAACGGKRGGHA